jgi:hypothetical protein
MIEHLTNASARRVLVAAALVLIATVGLVAKEAPPAAIPIFIGPQVRDGFVEIDRGVLDSIKDIQNELRGRRGIQIVADKERAQVVLEVVSRGATSTSGGGAVGVPIGTSTFMLPLGTIGIATVLKVGTYEKPIVLQNCETWRRCARFVAQDVETWVEANAATLTK